jgi:hypothetical protein
MILLFGAKALDDCRAPWRRVKLAHQGGAKQRDRQHHIRAGGPLINLEEST